MDYDPRSWLINGKQKDNFFFFLKGIEEQHLDK